MQTQMIAHQNLVGKERDDFTMGSVCSDPCRLRATLCYLASNPSQKRSLMVHILPNHNPSYLVNLVVILGYRLWCSISRPKLYLADGFLLNVHPLALK